MRHPFRTLIASSSSRALSALATPALIAFSSLIAGCSDDPPPPPEPKPSGTIELTDANNFTTELSRLNIETFKTAPEANLEFDWTGLKKDIQCHDVDATKDVDTVLFLRFLTGDKEEVARLLDAGTLDANDLKGPAPFRVDPADNDTKVKLSDFDNNGTQLDPTEHYTDEDRIYLAVFQKGMNLGQGAIAMVMVDPDPNESTTKVVVPSNEPDAAGKCPLLDYTANLHDLDQVPVPTAGPWVLDWSGIKNNSRGEPLEFSKIDRMLLGFYPDQSVEDLEADFLDLEQNHDTAWELKFSPHKALDIAPATRRDGSGEQFPGFDRTDGTWIMGLFCDSCQSPAPLVVTILKPE